MKKRLYLFTDCYPYGKGERPFLEPELGALALEFEVVIITQGAERRTAESSFELENGSSVRVICVPPLTSWRLFVAMLSFPLSKLFRWELNALMLDGFSWSRFARCVLEFARARNVEKFCERNGVFSHPEDSVYYTFWFNNEALAVAMRKSANPSIVWVSRIHGYDLYNERNPSGRQPFQRFMLAHVDRLLFLSPLAERYFIENFGSALNDDQFVQLGLGVRDCGKQPSSKAEDSFRLVSCSNMIPLKRINLIVEALALLDGRPIEWIHFGDGESRKAIERQCEELGVSVDIRGHVENQDVMEFYRTSYVDAFITASSTEGMPVSIEEAMSFGIPIIATNVGGIAYQVDANGVLLGANPSAREIADAIDFIRCSDPADIARMRSRSRNLWRTRFDASELREGLLCLLRKVGDVRDW